MMSVMAANGLAGLLASQATRELKLSCGFSLTFRKLRLADYVRKELEIIEQRGVLSTVIEEITESLKTVRDKGVRASLEKGLQEAVSDMATRPKYAYFGETYEFDMSPKGRAFILYLCTADNTELITCPEDALVLLESVLSQEDRDQIEELINWSSEIDLLKKPDSPSQPPDQTPTLIVSSDGETS